MTSTRLILSTLAVLFVACGGRAQSDVAVDDGDASSHLGPSTDADSGADADPSARPGSSTPADPRAGLDGGTCGFGWPAFSPTDCSWGFTFGDDPLACTGFALGSGTADECRAVCGHDAKGDFADSCVTAAIGDVASNYMLTCTITTGPGCS